MNEISSTINTILSLVDMSQDLRVNWILSDTKNGYIVVENECGMRLTYNENPNVSFEEILNEPVL